MNRRLMRTVRNLPRGRRSFSLSLFSEIAIAVMAGFVAVFLFCNVIYLLFVVLHLDDKYSVIGEDCEPTHHIKLLRFDVAKLGEINSEREKEIKELEAKLQLAGQEMDQALRQHLQLSEPRKAGPFGTVKGLRTSPKVLPDESVNPTLAKILENVAIRKELIVAFADSNVRDMLEIWFTSIQNVGIPNYFVVALDHEIACLCESKGILFYRRGPDEGLDSVGRTGISNNANISRMKFHILREFLQLGYSVLLSDVDIVYLQNPFDHLYRDSDVESMSDGHNNMTAYGYDDIFDEPSMGWGRYAHTMRIWVYNTGFFFIRPTIPSIELFDRVADRVAREAEAWDQAVFNDELIYPSRPGFNGLHASTRTMDIYLFMNSKVLFKTVRKDPNLSKLKPVVVHLNYHPDTLPRMRAVVDFYVHGKSDALKPFPDGSNW